MTCIHSCLLAFLCQVIFAIALLLARHLCAVFFPTLPLFSGQGKYWFVSIPTEQFSVTVPSAGRLLGYHAYLLSRAQALAGSINLVGTSAQSHLLVMSLIEKNDHVRKLIM